MERTPEPWRERDHGGMAGNETHSDRRRRERQKEGIQILKSLITI